MFDVILANGFITPESLVALGAELAEGAKTAEKVTLKYPKFNPGTLFF
jgi:hypothetical protein